MFTFKNRKAQTVLNAFIDKYDNDEMNFSIGSYQNGREQGFSITNYGKRNNENYFACFSEARRSDKIVVYISDFDLGQSITGGMYEGAVFFNPYEYEKAADYIYEKLFK